MHFPYVAIISFSALSESDSAVSVSAGASEVDPSHSKRSVEADTDIDVKRNPKIIREQSNHAIVRRTRAEKEKYAVLFIFRIEKIRKK